MYSILFPGRGEWESVYKRPDWTRVHRELACVGVTLRILHGCVCSIEVRCVLMLLYIAECLGVLFWVGDGVNPLDGPLLEFGQVPCSAFDFADAARRHAQRLADLLLGDAVAYAPFAQSGAAFDQRCTSK